MTHRGSPDSERLPERVATKLLSRASELDAALRSGASVAELRAAAAEAGISDTAFEAALAELQQPVPAPVRRQKRLLWAVTAAFTSLVIAVAAATIVIPSRIAVDTQEGRIPLRCISPAEAADLVRSQVNQTARITATIHNGGSNTIVVRGPAQEVQQIRTLIEERERSSSRCSNPR